MAIHMDVSSQQERGNQLEKGCLDCPHKFYFVRNAGSFWVNRELQQHRAICPGRKTRHTKRLKAFTYVLSESLAA